MEEPSAEMAAAIVAALAELTVIEKGRTAKIETKAGVKFSYGYADLADIVRATRPVLAKHGLVALTPIVAHGDGLACTVHLIHSSGRKMELGPFPFPHGMDARATGSMVTYHRRYALVAALGLAIGDEDDDGAAAVARQVESEYLPEPPIPGFRSSLIAARDALTEGERGLLRVWLEEQGLPASPAQMNADQADRVCDYILHGLPKEGVSDGG